MKIILFLLNFGAGLDWLSINIRQKVKEHYFSVKAKVSTLTLIFGTPRRPEDRNWNDSDIGMKSIEIATDNKAGSCGRQ